MKSKTHWIVTATCVCIGCSLLGLILVAAKPPAEAPITLHYRDTPVFLDPHESNVSALAFSADGQTLASGSGFLRL